MAKTTAKAEETTVANAELIQEATPQFTGYVNKNRKEFYYYPEEEIVFQGDRVGFFHFKKPTLRKAKANNVVLGNDMPAKAMEALIRASLLRIEKEGGGEILNCHFRDIIENLEMDEVTEITNHCSNFFVKTVE